MTIQTFSIVGRSADGTQLGVAVASKFLAVGAYVPAASADAGALATQALGNLELKTRGLELLRTGAAPADVFTWFFAEDSQAAYRQAGMVSRDGQAATYSGDKCMPWAGGLAAEDPNGSYAIQGNMLAGPHVIDAMVDAWKDRSAQSLGERLLASLTAGQEAGGDPRGKQAASLLVVGEGQGYGGLSDVAIDLRCDDNPDPIGELHRMLALHRLYFDKSPEASLLVLDAARSAQLATLLEQVGFGGDDVADNLFRWMGRENYEERWADGKIDPVVLEQLRQQAEGSPAPHQT
jgi:uncharacterized Ntn-hydrolase superfamily protein